MFTTDTVKLQHFINLILKLEQKIKTETGLNVKLVITQIGAEQSLDENRFIAEEKRHEDVITAAIGFVATKFEKKELEIIQSQSRELSKIRAILYNLLRDTFPKISQKKIGNQFKGRDHSTVAHGLKLFEQLWQTEPKFREQYVELKREWKTLMNLYA